MTDTKIIVIGNEKGGAGKTTTAMNLIISLSYLGFKITTIDTDVRQLSLTRYLENRVSTIENLNLDIPLPRHHAIHQSEGDEEGQLSNILEEHYGKADFIIIDTPGVNNSLSSLAHSKADIIITPVNDSFVDLDLLANVRAKDFKIIRPGIYSQMIWEQKINRAKEVGKSLDWIVVRNRIASVQSKNKRNIEKVVQELSKRLGCRLASGFGERVIFKELFLYGITLLDLKHKKLKPMLSLSMSHIAARQELLRLLKSLHLKEIDEKLKEHEGLT
jgi:chromosome partitioning protein